MPINTSLPKLLVILGPTATGKSALAIQMARKYNGEVVSADSRQVYSGLDIGTGKVTKREMQGVPHHLLDVASAKRQFSVAQYKKLTEKAIADILSRGKLPILCGGTGWYIDAVAENILTPEVPPNLALRKELAEKSLVELLAMLKKLDPERSESVEQKNPRRIIRAIEIAQTLGKVPALSQGEKKYDVQYIGLDLPDTKLKQNIHVRLLVRMKRGMIAEAKRLHSEGLSLKRMEELGLEYRYLALYLQNKISKEKMLEEIETKSWQYARRQRTWFQRNKKIEWSTSSPRLRPRLSFHIEPGGGHRRTRTPRAAVRTFRKK